MPKNRFSQFCGASGARLCLDLPIDPREASKRPHESSKRLQHRFQDAFKSPVKLQKTPRPLSHISSQRTRSHASLRHQATRNSQFQIQLYKVRIPQTSALREWRCISKAAIVWPRSTGKAEADSWGHTTYQRATCSTACRRKQDEVDPLNQTNETKLAGRLNYTNKADAILGAGILFCQWLFQAWRDVPIAQISMYQ